MSWRDLSALVRAQHEQQKAARLGGLPKTAKVGGARRDRTADLVNAIHALSHLSYGPDS
jgi:hypothetical protein